MTVKPPLRSRPRRAIDRAEERKFLFQGTLAEGMTARGVAQRLEDLDQTPWLTMDEVEERAALLSLLEDAP